MMSGIFIGSGIAGRTENAKENTEENTEENRRPPRRLALADPAC
jgi:hypothetical protein